MLDNQDNCIWLNGLNIELCKLVNGLSVQVIDKYK